MKITINIQALRQRIKDVFKEKAPNEYCNRLQLQEVGVNQDVWLVREYYTKKSKKPIVKCCKFSDSVEERLQIPVQFYGLNMFEWLKYADDIEECTMILNENNNRYELYYNTIDGGSGNCDLHMDDDFEMKDLIDIQNAWTIVEPKQLETMKGYVDPSGTRPSMSRIYIDNGVMVATDSHVLKIKDIDCTEQCQVNTNGIKEEDEYRYPAYKSVLPTGNKMKLHLHKKSLKKTLECWLKTDTTDYHLIKFDIDEDNNLKLIHQDIDYSIYKEVRLGKQEDICNNFQIGFNMQMLLRILRDRDLKEEFDMNIRDNCTGMVIAQQHELWLQMPIMI